MAVSLGRIASEGVAWTSLKSVLVKMIGIVYITLVLSHLTVYEYGVVELLISIPPLLGILSLPGLIEVIVADIGRERGSGDQKLMAYIMESYMALRLPLAVLSWALLFFSAPLVELYYNEAIGSMVQVLSFAFLFNPFRTWYMVTFQVGLQYKYAALYRLCEEIGKLSVVAFCFLVLDLSAAAVIFGYVSTDVFGLTILAPFFLRTRREVFGPFHITGGWKDPLYTIRKHGKWSVFGTYLNVFGQNIRPWLIKFFLGTNAVGIYAVAFGMFQNTMSLMPVSQVVSPLIPQYIDKKKRLYRLLDASIKYHLLSSIIAGLIMIVTMPILIHFFFPLYSGSYPLFIAIMATAIPFSLSSVFQAVFTALKAQRNLFNASVFRLALVVTVLPVALSIFGLYGIAVEIFLTTALYSFNRYRKLHELLPEYQFNFRGFITITETDRDLYHTVYRKINWVVKLLGVRST